MSAPSVWPVVIETSGWEVRPIQIGRELDVPPAYESMVGPAGCELRPVYRREGEGQPYQALLVVRVGSRELVVRLARVDVERMHAALCSEEPAAKGEAMTECGLACGCVIWRGRKTAADRIVYCPLHASWWLR